MHEIETPVTSPPITVRFSADEFEQLAELFYRRAKADNPLTRDVIRVAEEHGLNYRYGSRTLIV